MGARKLSMLPGASPFVDKAGRPGQDWVRWFQDVFYFVDKLLNRYDADRSGTAILVAGTVTVTNTQVTATTRVRLTAQNEGSANIGDVYVSARTPGTGFTIKSGNALDNREIFYELVEAF